MRIQRQAITAAALLAVVLAPILLIIGYCVLVPLAILK